MNPPERTHDAASPVVKIVAVASLALMISAQIALPLAPDFAPALVTTVVATLVVASFLIATFSWEPKKILGMVALVPLGLGIEVVGEATGLPFGGYEYGTALQPQVFGVPFVVPLAWAGITLAAWEIGRRITANRTRQVIAGGLAIAAWDLFLDPLMVDYGYWKWDNPSGWQDIPLTNFAGWIVAGTLLCAVASRILGPGPANAGLAGLYVWMIVFSAFGFLLPFAFDRPAAGLVLLIAATPLMVAALIPKERPWLR